MPLQSVIEAVYPPGCIGCDAPMAAMGGLCPSCWPETRFLRGLVCDTCGVPLPGQDTGESLQCDDCLTVARPWMRGRATLAYSGVGRRLVLALKHGDRTDLIPTLAKWSEPVLAPFLDPETVLVPVPLHWTRLLRRRFNQAALLALALGRTAGAAVQTQALVRARRTVSLEGHSRTERFATLADAIAPHPKLGGGLAGRPVVIVDDVMTSGATFAAATEAALTAGAARVDVLALARVVKDA